MSSPAESPDRQTASHLARNLVNLRHTRGLTQKRIDDHRCLVEHLLAVRRPLRRPRCLLLCLRQHADERELDQARHGNQQQPLRE